MNLCWICYILFALISISALFFNCGAFNDMQCLPKWISTLLFICLFGIVYSIKLFINPVKKNGNLIVYMAILIGSSLAQMIYAFFQIWGWMRPYIGQDRIIGSFDTVAGLVGCLCAGIPLAFIGLENENLYIRRITGLLITVSLFVIIVSQSRAGVVSIIVVLFCFFLHKTSIKKVYKLKIVIGGMCFLLIGCYFMKKASADGRLLIWRCSWNMIEDSLLLGHGLGAFDAQYMDYQARFFIEYPDSRYLSLADNVKHIFNEYLSIVVQFGIVGGTIHLIV